jgi:hypothetical protein
MLGFGKARGGTDVKRFAGVALAMMTAAIAFPAVADGTDLCTFVKAAIGGLPNNFADLNAGPADAGGAYGVSRDLIPDQASNCGVGHAGEGRDYIACFWMLHVAAPDVAKAKLDGLTGRLRACLGHSYKERPGQAGGIIFYDTPDEDRALSGMFLDKAGEYQIYATVTGHGAHLH